MLSDTMKRHLRIGALLCALGLFIALTLRETRGMRPVRVAGAPRPLPGTHLRSPGVVREK